MPFEPRFIEVREMMENICEGLGRGHRTLVATSATRLATLVVKNAEIVVDFELSSSAARSSDAVDVTRPVLGAKTLSFALATQSSQWEERKLNKASIKLSVVSVTETVDVDGAAEAKKLAALIDALKAALAKMPSHSNPAWSRMIAQAEADLAAGKVAAARELVLELLIQRSALK